MNTKIKIWIAVGIIFSFSIMVAEFFWLNSKNKVSVNTPSTLNSQESITQKPIIIPAESENKIIKECGQDKKICPDGILVSRILSSNCEFPICAKGKYDMSDSTYKTYTNDQYGIGFKYPNELTVSNFVDHESEYDGDLIVKMDYLSSEKDRMNIKLYFSKNLSKYPDLSKTATKLRKSTGASVNELHSFGFTGFEGYEILWWKAGGKNIKEENYQFLKIDNGFYYFKTDSIQPLKDSEKYIYGIISTFESTKN